MQVRLEVSHERANVQQVFLRADTLIGRSADCNLRILSTEVSRRHCRIIVASGAVLIRDLGSSNGTFIDGIQLEPEIDVAIAPGSQLSVAGVKFIVHFDPLADSLPSKSALGALDSTVDYVPGKTRSRRAPRNPSQARPPRSPLPRNTVPNHPGETVRNAADRAAAPTVRPKAAEPRTELFEGLAPAGDSSDSELTVLEFLPDWDADTTSPPPRGG
jgi:pSer/pThr/pTyr-binding forkhead associated (FHA) protein